MSTPLLLRSQQNAVLLMIKESGLSRHEFELIDPYKASPRGTRFITRLVHIPSGFWFHFGERSVSFSPGKEAQQDDHTDQDVWNGKIWFVGRWLEFLKREIEAPDLWASLAQDQEMLGAEPPEAVNTPFSAEEQVQVKRAIEEIRVYISATYSLASEPLATVNRKLDYLIDASTRLGRIDWKNILVAALITLALERVIPSGPGLRELLGTAWHLLRHVLSGVISPPLLY